MSEEYESSEQPLKTITSLGLEENVEAAGAYLFGLITGVLLITLEKDNKFVRFHAVQSIITFFVLIVVNTIVALMPYYLWFISSIIYMLGVVLWLLLMIKAYQGEKFKLPVIGAIAEGQVK